MAMATISSKYQLAIPAEIRKKLHISPNQKVIVLEKGGIIHIILQRPLRDTKGFVKKMDTKDIREKADRY